MEFYKRKSQLKNTLKETGLFAAFDVLRDDGKMLKLSLKPAVLRLLHKFNNDSLVIKYYITAENFIVAKITYIGFGSSFNSYEFVELLEDGLGIVSNIKSDIMDVL